MNWFHQTHSPRLKLKNKEVIKEILKPFVRIASYSTVEALLIGAHPASLVFNTFNPTTAYPPLIHRLSTASTAFPPLFHRFSTAFPPPFHRFSTAFPPPFRMHKHMKEESVYPYEYSYGYPMAGGQVH